MTRPADVWRVCGRPLTDGEGRGCTCAPNDPTRRAAEKAVARLDAPHRNTDRQENP